MKLSRGLGAALFLVLGAAIACQRSSPATEGVGTPQGSATSSASGATVTSTTSAASSTTPASPSALGLTNVFPGTLAIENTSDAPVRLATVPVIETPSSAGVWTKVEGLDLEGLPGKGMRLVESCSDTPAECVTIPPHGVFHPVRWSGMSCSAQCNGTCRANAYLGGRYRWVVKLCDGGAQIAGPPFDLPKELAEHDRVGVTQELVSATAARIDAIPPKWDGTVPASPSAIAAMPVRPGSEHPMDPVDLATLVALLRDAKNFDDQIEKRCAMKTLVGFRFVRRPASTIPTHEEPAELVVDFTCMALFVVHGGEGTKPRVVAATHFDPARAAMVALVKKVFPTDGELAKLK
jgi:hypothetical protein